MSLRQQVEDLLSRHQQQASNSPYDHKVAIMAISAAGSLIARFDWSDDESADQQRLVAELDALRERYYDSDGEYTSGKGEIGSLTADIRQLECGTAQTAEPASDKSGWQRLLDWLAR